jgi:hypothetical protein
MDISDFKLQPATVQVQPASPARARRTELFLKGPVPMLWLAAASGVPRKNALAAGIVVFHVAGIKRADQGLTVTATRAKEVLGLGKKAFQRGLRDLEERGLIRVERVNGRAAVVDIVWNPESGGEQ